MAINRSKLSVLSMLVGGLMCIVGCSPSGSFKITAVPRDQTVEARIVERHPGWIRDRIAIIDVSGVLMNSEEVSLLSEGEHVVSYFVEKLNAAAVDSRVKAVVLRINSPGGTVGASEAMYHEIVAFKKKTGKPVIAYFQDVAASGAYYIACACDEIIAQPSTITGSIGVIMQMFDLTGTMEKLGVETDAITSGEFKDAGSPLRPMRTDERALFQELVNGFYGTFLDVVIKGRPGLNRDQVVTLADGRVYLGSQALVNGLVDKLGTMHDAVESAKQRAGVNAAHVVLYHRPLEWKPTVYAQAPTGNAAPIVNLININLPLDFTKRPRFMYIWAVE